jgi:hypothetical protein
MLLDASDAFDAGSPASAKLFNVPLSGLESLAEAIETCTDAAEKFDIVTQKNYFAPLRQTLVNHQ